MKCGFPRYTTTKTKGDIILQFLPITQTLTLILFHSFIVYLGIITPLFVQQNAQLDCSRSDKTYIKIYIKIYVFYRLKHNICISSHWWNINYIRATCFGRKTAIIRPMQNIYKVQYMSWGASSPSCRFNNKEFCVLHVQSNTTIFYLVVQ